MNVVAQKEAAPQSPAQPVPVQVQKDDALPKVTAPEPVPQVVPAVQSGASAEAPAKPVAAASGATQGTASSGQKNADYVYVMPDYKKQDAPSALPDKKQDAASTPAAAANPASTRAVEAATTVAKERPPVLIAAG